jgi:large subunit ribosomal protein L25
MKQRIELNVESRETGRANSRALRVNKMIPAVIYGSVEPINVSIHENDVIKYKARAFENALLNLKSTKVAKANGIVALFKEVTVNPLTRRPVHVDLFSLDLTKAVRVFVEIKIEGKAIGLAEGGMLSIVSRQVEIECLPTAIPDFITVDVTNLNIGDSVHVSDITLADGLKFISRPELTIAACTEIEEEVIAAPVAAAAAAAPVAAAGGKAAAAPAAGKAAPKAPAAKK